MLVKGKEYAPKVLQPEQTATVLAWLRKHAERIYNPYPAEWAKLAFLPPALQPAAIQAMLAKSYPLPPEEINRTYERPEILCHIAAMILGCNAGEAEEEIRKGPEVWAKALAPFIRIRPVVFKGTPDEIKAKVAEHMRRTNGKAT